MARPQSRNTLQPGMWPGMLAAKFTRTRRVNPGPTRGSAVRSHLAASRPVVFLQYLAAIAIVEAVKTYDN